MLDSNTSPALWHIPISKHHVRLYLLEKTQCLPAFSVFLDLTSFLLVTLPTACQLLYISMQSDITLEMLRMLVDH